MKIVKHLVKSWLFFCIFSGAAYAQDYYVCNDGSDDNPGTSPAAPWATFDYAISKFSELNAGDSLLFCRNGMFSLSKQRVFNQNCTASLPCTIADYEAPGTSPQSNAPLIQSIVGKGGVRFEDGGNADHDEGYVLKNLSFKGNGIGYGIFLYNDVDWLTIDNVTIDGYEMGVYSAGSNQTNLGANQVNENIVLKNSTIKNNSVQGWLGGCDNCLIDNNNFINNGFGKAVYNHNMYISGNNNSDITVSNNTLYKSTAIRGKCKGASLVVHGVVTNLTIKGNHVYEDIGGSYSNCWGITVDPGYASEESFTNVLIANNVVSNVGSVGIGCASCTQLQIIDNLIIHAQDYPFAGIVVPDKVEDTVKSDGIFVSGNYIDLKDPNNKGKTGISIIETSNNTIGLNNVLNSN